MLKIDRRQLSEADAKMLDMMLAALVGQPEKVVFQMLDANPAFKHRIEYRDQSLLDTIDSLAAANPQALRFSELIAALEQAEAVREAERNVMINLHHPSLKRDVDHLNRKILKLTFLVSEFPRYAEAEEEYERARGRISAEWNRMIPETLIPKTAENGNGSRGMRRRLPRWEIKNDRVVCRREQD